MDNTPALPCATEINAASARFRQFQRSGVIQTSVGIGAISDPAFGQPAVSQPLRHQSNRGIFTGFYIDSATNDIVHNIERSFMIPSANIGASTGYTG